MLAGLHGASGPIRQADGLADVPYDNTERPCVQGRQVSVNPVGAKIDNILKSKRINGWNLFWLVTAPISLVMLLTMVRVDLSSAENVSSMIQLSVRIAVPWLFVAFAASSLQVVFPGSFSRWLLRNRKVIGLCFAAAMGWQLFFILWLVGAFLIVKSIS